MKKAIQGMKLNMILSKRKKRKIVSIIIHNKSRIQKQAFMLIK